MTTQQLELGEFEIPEQELRRAYDRGVIEGFSVEEALADPLMRRLLEMDVERHELRRKVRREPRA